MAEPFGGMPPELFAEFQALQRKQKLTELLTQQSMQPLEPPVVKGRFQGAISPFQVLGKGMQAWAGMQDQQANDKAMAGLGQRYQAGSNDAMAQYIATRQGTPGSSENIIDEQALGGEGAPATINAPGVAGDPRKAVMDALVSRYPGVRKIGELDYAQLAKPPVKTDLGDRFKVEYPDGRVVYEPKGVTPDASFKEGGLDRRFSGVSGNTAATVAGQSAQGDLNRGVTTQGQNLSAQTARRGQDIGASTALAGQAVTTRGQDVSATTARAALAQAGDLGVQGRLAEAKAGGKERGEAQAQAVIGLPKAIDDATQAVDLIDQMVGDLQVDLKAGQPSLRKGGRSAHPGFSVGVGASVQPGFQYIPGTDKAGFYALKEQVLGGVFLQAFETLKGGGQITEIEGRKATQAKTRMDTAQNENEFIAAAREYQGVIRSGVERAKRKAAGAGAPRIVDW